VPDIMMWIAVLACLVAVGLLALALACVIRYFFPRR
jgi:hypothetical protein